MQNIIYHLHDVCCNHSSLTLEDAIDYSIKHGYKALYWTEHSPVTIKCGYQHRRSTYAQIADLKRRIDECNKKYENKFHIYFGYEVEFNPPNKWYYESLARDPYCEFLINGVHFYGDLFKDPWPYKYTINDSFTVANLKEYKQQFKLGMESGLFSWIPHPEIWLNSYAKWDRHAKSLAKFIIKSAIKTNTPLAFNVNFKNPKSEWHYPSIYFWKEVAKTNIPVIVESDAHSLDKIEVEWIKNAHKLVNEYGINKNIVDRIPIRWLPKKPLLVLYEDDLIKSLSFDMLSNLKQDNVKFVKIKSRSNLIKVCKKHKVHPLWTICLLKSNKLIDSTHHTNLFVVADDPKANLKLKELATYKYDQFLKCFIKEINY